MCLNAKILNKKRAEGLKHILLFHHALIILMWPAHLACHVPQLCHIQAVWHVFLSYSWEMPHWPFENKSRFYRGSQRGVIMIVITQF